MQRILTNISLLIACFLLICGNTVRSQESVGIGTPNPHVSAILEISDSSRGVLIPRTTTDAVDAFVNSLNPNPGVADGLMIFDTILNTYMYWDEVQAQWLALVSLVGPTGPTGPKGATGATGATGLMTDWRDSLGFDQRVLQRDTCGDWFLDLETGKIWWMWCDTLGGTKPRRWVDTVFFDNYIGELMAPDERVEVFSVHASGNLIETMANDTQVVIMKQIPGLAASVTVNDDEIAYIWFAAHGTVSKQVTGSDISYAQYDFDIGGQRFYESRNMAHIVSVLPHGPAPACCPLDGYADRTGWYISGNHILTGDITPVESCRCGTPQQDPSCICPGGSVSVTISVFAGNRYSGSSTSSTLILGDELGKVNESHLNVIALIRRNPAALPRKR